MATCPLKGSPSVVIASGFSLIPSAPEITGDVSSGNAQLRWRPRKSWSAGISELRCQVICAPESGDYLGVLRRLPQWSLPPHPCPASPLPLPRTRPAPLTPAPPPLTPAPPPAHLTPAPPPAHLTPAPPHPPHPNGGPLWFSGNALRFLTHCSEGEYITSHYLKRRQT